MLNIIRVHHIAVIASDCQNSKRFHTDVLGLKIIAENFRRERNSYKLDLRVSDTERIELFSFPGAPARPNRPEACGLRHLAFQVPDLDEAVSYLCSRHVQVEPVRVDEHTGKRFTFFADPDNLPLELYEL